MTVEQSIIEEIKNADKIVITSHRSADGDSIGSSVAMMKFIETLGKKAQICHPDPCPDYLKWATNEISIFDFETAPDLVTNYLIESDLIFCLDYNGANRLGNEMGQVLENSSGKKVMIDHHPFPQDFVDIAISEPTVCSTCELIYELIDKSGNKNRLNQEIATPIYLGLMTDTGSFRFSNVKARTHEILSDLLNTGMNHTKVHENTFDNNRIDRLKLRGYATSEKLELIVGYPVAIMALSESDLNKFNYIKGDTEGLVNIALSVEGVKAAIFMAEKDNAVKLSFRSKDDIAVNVIASENFEGGGHTNAAGGISFESLEVTIAKVKSLIPKYFNPA